MGVDEAVGAVGGEGEEVEGGGDLEGFRVSALPSQEEDLLFFCPDALSKRKGAHSSPFSAWTLAEFLKPQRRRIYMADYIALSPRAALMAGHWGRNRLV